MRLSGKYIAPAQPATVTRLMFPENLLLSELWPKGQTLRSMPLPDT